MEIFWITFRSDSITTLLLNPCTKNGKKEMNSATAELLLNKPLDALVGPGYRGWYLCYLIAVLWPTSAYIACSSVRDHIASLLPTTLPIFTDGSALGNPGPCGSAAVIYINGLAKDPVTLSKPVALKSTSFHGEVAAVSLALGYVAQCSTITQDKVLVHHSSLVNKK